MGAIDDFNALRRSRQRQEEADYGPGDQVRLQTRGRISEEIYTIAEVTAFDVRFTDGTWHDISDCVRPPLDFQIDDQVEAVSDHAKEAFRSAQTGRVCGVNDESGVLIVRPAGRRDTVRVQASGCRKVTVK